jgi:hypothetical protein
MERLHRRVPAQELRGVEAVLLEVMTSDLIEKPIGQLAPENVADLFALAVCPEAPVGLQKRLPTFLKRIAAEVLDLPNGVEFLGALATFAGLPGARVPDGLRDLWRVEGERPKRSAAERAAIEAALAGWASEAPEAFAIAKPAPPTVRAPIGARPASRPVVRNLAMVEPTFAPPRHGSAGAARPERAARAPATPKPRPMDDPARNRWLDAVLLERLSAEGVLERGLAEIVLLGAVKHRARDVYPELTPVQIRERLRALEKGEPPRVRFSAGRWILKTGR